MQKGILVNTILIMILIVLCIVLVNIRYSIIQGNSALFSVEKDKVALITRIKKAELESELFKSKDFLLSLAKKHFFIFARNKTILRD